MNTQVALCLTLAFFVYGGYGATISFTNNCPYPVWPGTLPNAGSSPLSKTGFELQPKQSTSVEVPSPWSGRFWARTGCSSDSAGRFTCATADCGSGQVECNGNGGSAPLSLIELHVAEGGGQDFYDVSHVDGFNLPTSIAPQGGNGDCKTSTCVVNINDQCLEDLRVPGSDGKVIACKSACGAFGGTQYCCKPDDTPQTCPPTTYSQFFENLCPLAYSYAKDDVNSTFTCSGGPNYAITFCP